FRKVILNDINKDLMNTYRIIKEKPYELIKELEKITNEFFSLDEEGRKEYYYKARELFNKLKKEENNLIKSSALFIFLNKTCYNGLFRVNKKGDFNVPYGRYKNPKIFDKQNLLKISKVLRNVTLLNKDFEAIEEYVDNKTFVYFDPPYKPISKTSSFTSYNSKEFDDKEQIRLSEFFKKLDKKGAKLMLSNSCVLDFFNKLFSNFKIRKINAKRMINSKGDKRGQEVCELIITNY
ncbi:MAG: Dam family site-specific DNA-(adenine-N6)-methyltransferase, partial [Nanoarchaeota archaeon]